LFVIGLRVNDHTVVLQAYQKPRSTAVQIARIAAVTLVLISFILGAFILAAAWIEASASCQQLAQLQALAIAQVSPRNITLRVLVWKYERYLTDRLQVTGSARAT
jgi:hypothetical protein